MVTIDEMVHPDDILEEVELEFDSNAFDGTIICAECGEVMERVVSTTTIYEGQITIEFEHYRCPHCGWERMTLEQARQLQTIKHFFTNLSAESAAHETSRARVRPLTSSHFLVQVG